MDAGKTTRKIKAFDVINGLLMILFILIMAYPLWFIIVGALNEGKDYMRGGVYLWPRVWTLDNFKAVFRDKSILKSFSVTIAKCAAGTETVYITVYCRKLVCTRFPFSALRGLVLPMFA